MRRSSRGNPNHYPKGSSRGGQFAPKCASGVLYSEMSDEEYEERTKKRQAEAKVNIEEAESRARNLGVTPFYEGMDPQVANEINDGLEIIFNDYPELKGEIKYVGNDTQITQAMQREYIEVASKAL